MKEKERLKIPRWLNAMSERREKKAINLLSTTNAELVEFGRGPMGQSSDWSSTFQLGGRVSELKKTDGGKEVAMNESEVDVKDVQGDQLREMSA